MTQADEENKKREFSSFEVFNPGALKPGNLQG
jgi:hypothetical protein